MYLFPVTKKGCPYVLFKTQGQPFSTHYGLTNRKHAISAFFDKSEV